MTRLPACRSAVRSGISGGDRRRDARVHRHVSRHGEDGAEEGFEEVADWFETLAKAEKSHAGCFQKALDPLD